MNTSENKLFGIPRPLAGALIGIAVFLLILLPLKALDYNSTALYFVEQNLELLGRIAILILGMTFKVDMSRSITDLISLTISAIPPAMLGMLFASAKNSTRTQGIIYTVLYLVFLLACGGLMRIAGV
ncbi:MAG: hypothetical protein IT314_03995 [Anaerolineales bacterium]|nr:hypothetical protein [Anaerolineales bacterium]